MSTDGLTLTRTFAAPRELVFDAWTTPEHFSVWFGGETVSVPVDSIVLDARPGGTWKARMDLPGGHTINWVGEYLEVVRPERLVQTLADDPSSDERETLTIVLAEAGVGTEMTLTQTGGHLTPEQYEQTKAGYQEFLDAMDALLATLV